MSSPTEDLLREALHELSDQAPHDPTLLDTVLSLTRSTDQGRAERKSNARVVLPGLAAALVAASVAVAVGVGVDRNDSSAEPTPATEQDLSAEEVEKLTRLGRADAPFDDAKVEAAWKQKWGVSDIGSVSDALRDAAKDYPRADAGLSYDADTLTYTQWTVRDASQAESLRERVRSAFESLAEGSNLALEFGTSPTPEGAAEPLMSDMTTASRTDPQWPENLDMSGHWSQEAGKFMLAAGDAHDDPAVIAYFERRWPGLVVLTDATLYMQ